MDLSGDGEVREVRVELGSRSYDIVIGQGLLKKAGSYLAALGLSGRCLVVTNPTVGKIYAERLRSSLEESGLRVALAEVPDSEQAKSLEQASRLYDTCLAAGLDRRSPVLALGGGVVGDLAGFVAASYMRGVPFIQLPTTLLAQVDSSVGGKVAVNHPGAKNIIGAFYQPRLVLADLETLTTLPGRELRAGLAEVIKYGVIRDAGLFCYLEKTLPGLTRGDLPEAEGLGGASNPRGGIPQSSGTGLAAFLACVVDRSCRIKAEVVGQDETESGLRAILNFGHTVGHALEAVAGYDTYRHGEAVAIGMVAAARLAVRRGLYDEADCLRLERLLRAAGLPAGFPASAGASCQDLLSAMFHDKKNTTGPGEASSPCGPRLTFVLPEAIGRVRLERNVTPAEVLSCLLEGC